MGKRKINRVIAVILMAMFTGIAGCKKAGGYTEDLVAVVAYAVGCSQEKAEALLLQVEDVTNSKVISAENVDINELPENVRQILDVEVNTPNERYFVYISEEGEILKIISLKDKLVLYDKDACTDMH